MPLMQFENEGQSSSLHQDSESASLSDSAIEVSVLVPQVLRVSLTAVAAAVKCSSKRPNLLCAAVWRANSQVVVQESI